MACQAKVVSLQGNVVVDEAGIDMDFTLNDPATVTGLGRSGGDNTLVSSIIC